MNSSLQCLSNTKFMTKFFIDGTFKQDLNEDNKLGTDGHLCFNFAKLLHQMWNEEAPVVSPFTFKKVIGQFQPMFSGFAQHDSAELLSYVLDGIHEDLNRVKKKPYVNTPDFIGFSEAEKADMQWKCYLLRNQSIVVDLMQAQFKSTLQCPTCNRISTTYDPYLMLSLPIPQNETISDIYYIDIGNFDTIYKVATSSGNSGGGDNAPQFAKLQKDIITATLKLIQNKDSMPAEEYAINLQSLYKTQVDVRNSIASIVQRAKLRGRMLQQEQNEIVDALADAVTAMK